MTKKVIYTTLASTLLSGAAFADGGNADVSISNNATAATGSFETSLTAGYHSKYIWRGLDLGNDLVDLAVETSGSYAGFDLTAGVWQARITDQVAGAPKNETDVYAEVAKDLGFATASVGYIYYHFSDSSAGVDDAQEVYFGLSKDIAGISTSLTYFWDIETDNQGYAELALEKAISCPITKLSFDSSVTLGYLVEEGALSHLTAKVSKSFDLFSGITATPYVAYTVELDDLERYASTSEQNELFGGVSFSYSF